MKKAGVIGWPVEHSRSPLIHGYWLKTHGLEGSYDAIPLEPENADTFFADFLKSGFTGANVTIPHKEIVINHLDYRDEAAEAIGAVNTIWIENGAVKGTNTDWLGFLGNLDQKSLDWDKTRKTALVLGAGGASRAVIYGLLQRGFNKIWLANRTLARAGNLASHFGDAITPISLESAQDFVAEVDIIVNTTSLGMDNNPPLKLDLKHASEQCLITDIVYAPLKTPLLAKAQERGLETVDGLGMLLHQAVPGFEHWFGVRPAVTDELRMLIEKDMGLS